MAEIDVRAELDVLDSTDVEATDTATAARPAPPASPLEVESPAVRAAQPPRPVVLVDPNDAALAIARSLRARRIPVVALSARRLEPALFARGVRRRALPDLAKQPERWRAALLELAARLEPRPIVLPCSRQAASFLARSCHAIGPHFEVAAREESGPAPDIALRRALARGEAVLEVQLVRDGAGTTTGACVLAWAPAATPDVVVSSVEGSDIVRRSQAWAASHGIVGYLRLLWAPDRFGRLALHAQSPLPGPSLALARADGVDFAILIHAALAGDRHPVVQPKRALVRRIACLEPDSADTDLPLVDTPVEFHWLDPMPALAHFIRTLVRP